MTVRTTSSAAGDGKTASRLPFDESRYVSIAVVDTGCGIPACNVERIAEPFFTTKPAGKNAGLGLCMVRGFVERSGGYLVVNSVEGPGSVFRIFLPIVNG